jgi:hypothetical protein
MSYQPVVPTVQICMPRGMVWPFTRVAPLETVTLPSSDGIIMAAAPVYCTLPSGPSWKSPERVSN